MLQTTLGDLTLALYDDAVALATAAAVGAIQGDDESFFPRRSGFVAQIAECASGRRVAMNDEQRALATKTIPGVFKGENAALDAFVEEEVDDADSATSSFSILLGEAKHLDGSTRYLVRWWTGRRRYEE